MSHHEAAVALCEYLVDLGRAHPEGRPPKSLIEAFCKAIAAMEAIDDAPTTPTVSPQWDYDRLQRDWSTSPVTVTSTDICNSDPGR